jgi:anaphase-promoting complex subunit 2
MNICLVPTLELLKIRFGEDDLHKCEVMIKDVSGSKKLNTDISRSIEMEDGSFDVTATIISGAYWPQLMQMEMTHHPRIDKALTKFSDCYKVCVSPFSPW